MRRGIPFGQPLEADPAGERGLVFNCYVTSIENQFEFIQQAWANSATFAGGSGGPTGPDPVIGTDGTFNLALADGGRSVSLAVKRVIVTAGAVYALTLSLPALHALAQGELLAA